jgi:hypothetical protein
LFNLRHAKLRNVVERVFGVVKKRFPALSHGVPYTMDFQVKFVYAICGLHNFINCHKTDGDTLYSQARAEYLANPNTTDNTGEDFRDFVESSTDFAVRKRGEISVSIWDQFNDVQSRI